MEIVELVTELAPIVLSLFATIVAFMKGKTKKTKSVDEIKAAADKKYFKYIDKQCKKNKIANVSVETNKNEEVEV